ncbi:MAG: FkbM family methyltransferase [Planctomycetota bacterium]|jgi:FkbM family methyltransferase
MILTQDDVKWAYRILLDRECESEEMVEEKIGRLPNRKRLREDLLQSAEYCDGEKDFRKFIRADECLVIKKSNGFRIHLDLSDYISMEIANDNYDLPETQFVKRAVKAGDTVVDLGAHVGYYTFLFASLVGKKGQVFSFEPQERFFALIQQSIEENGYKGRIIAENCCVGSVSGKGKIAQHDGPGDYGCTHLLNASSSVPMYSDMTIESVNVINLADYKFQSPIDFIKIDIEGNEYLALSVFTDRLKKDKPIIMSEVNNPLLIHVSERSSMEYIKLLRDCGYECYILGEEVFADGFSVSSLITSRKEVITDIPSECQNVIFLPKDKI